MDEADKPIRIAPNVLLFPQPAALKDIYCNPKCDTKSEFYGTGVLGPPHLFATLASNDHKILRKALGGPHVHGPYITSNLNVADRTPVVHRGYET